MTFNLMTPHLLYLLLVSRVASMAFRLLQ